MNLPIQASDNAVQRKLLAHLPNRLPELRRGELYSLEAILGADFWLEEDESHHSLGHAFSGLVKKGRVPFLNAGLTSDRHNRYRCTGPLTERELP